MRSTSRRRSSRRTSSRRWVLSMRLPCSRDAASRGLTEKHSATARNASFHMPPASLTAAAAAVRLCNQLFPQVAVGILDVAAQLVTFFRRHLARALGAALALAVGVAHVVAHALAVLLLHLPRLLLAVVLPSLLLP